MLPPRLRHWKRGTPQIGVFLRTRDGGKVIFVNNTATDDQEVLVSATIAGLPESVMVVLRTWFAEQSRSS